MPRTAKPKRRPGRPKTYKYLPFAEARTFIREQMIPSRKKYVEWHDLNKPRVVPKYPNRAYKDDWTTWNDYLGTNNKFNDGHEARKRYLSMRPYDQAALWVHGLKLDRMEDWLHYCQENPIPEDIPTRPDLTYPEWRGWKHWLGKFQADTIELSQKVVKTRLLTIIHERGYPSNVWTFNMDLTDVASVRKNLSHDRFGVVKLYWFKEDQMKMLEQIINQHTSPYFGDENHRITRNTNNLMWVLDSVFDSVSS